MICFGGNRAPTACTLVRMSITADSVTYIRVLAIGLQSFILGVAAVRLGIIEVGRILAPLSGGSNIFSGDGGNRNMAEEFGIVGDRSSLGTASGRRRGGGGLGGGEGFFRCRGRSTKGVEVAESLGGGGGGSEEEGGALHVGWFVLLILNK